MKKIFKLFFGVWILVVAVFNAIIFIVPNEVLGITRFDKPLFWISYAFVMVSLLGQLIVALIFSKKDSPERKFLGFSLLKAEYSALSLSLVIGVLFMTLPVLPAWVGSIICILALAFNIIVAIKVTVATNYVEQVGEKVKTQTQFIRLLTADAQTLPSLSSDEKNQALARKVFEAIRFSDPMSNNALQTKENDIKLKYDELKIELKNNSNKCETIANELLLLIQERNAMCKALK